MSNLPHLPLTRINTIMKSSSDSEVISRESTVLMARATELFIRQLASEGYNLAEDGAKRLTYKHLAEVVNTHDKYEFVRDIMPRKITVAHYYAIMEERNKRLQLEAAAAQRKASTAQDEEEQQETSASGTETDNEGTSGSTSEDGSASRASSQQ